MSPIISSGGVAGASTPAAIQWVDEVGASGVQVRTSPDGSDNLAPAGFWGNILGGGHGWGSSSVLGYRIRASNGAGVGARTDLIDWRISQNLSTNNPPLIVIKQRKFTFSCAVLVAAASDGCEIGISMAPDALSVGNNQLGYVIRSVADVWTGIRRLTTGVAESAVALLQSFSSTVPRRFRMEYTEGNPPSLKFFLDGTLIMSQGTQAAMPTAAVGFAQTYGPKVSAAGGATIYTTAADMRMEYLV